MVEYANLSKTGIFSDLLLTMSEGDFLLKRYSMLKDIVVNPKNRIQQPHSIPIAEPSGSVQHDCMWNEADFLQRNSK